MAHYSVHVGTVRRSIGQNAIESASYISRSKLTLHQVDKEYNIPVSFTYDYSKKGGLAFSKIYAPENAPEWVSDRQELWNKAELAENRSNAETAGKIMIALPNELSDEQNIELLEKIVDELVKFGMVVDANIHNDSDGNPHAHLQHTFREFVKNKYGEYDFSPLKNADWRGPQWTRCIREMIAEKINESYLEHGFTERVTHKSYKELGIDLTPTVHEGPARNMHNAELTELNRQIAAENAEKIKEDPTIILRVVGVNHPVFTKEQIAKELEKRLYSGIDFSKIDDVESLNNELQGEFVKDVIAQNNPFETAEYKAWVANIKSNAPDVKNTQIPSAESLETKYKENVEKVQEQAVVKDATGGQKSIKKVVENAANNSNLDYNKDVGEVLRNSLSPDMKTKLDELDNEKNKGDGSESEKRDEKISNAIRKSKSATGNYTGLRVLEKVGDNSTEVLQDLGIEEKKENKGNKK